MYEYHEAWDLEAIFIRSPKEFPDFLRNKAPSTCPPPLFCAIACPKRLSAAAAIASMGETGCDGGPAH